MTIKFDNFSLFEFIKAMDFNKDGKVSREELLHGVEKYFVGKTAKAMPGIIYYLYFACVFIISLRLVESKHERFLSNQQVRGDGTISLAVCIEH